MNILVTGGAGFIGSHLCERLISSGHKVVCLDNFNPYYEPGIKKKNISTILRNPNFKLIVGDIRKSFDLDTCLEGNHIDLCIHLAAMAGVRPSLENPELYNDVNIVGTLQVLDACKKYNVKKMIFASSSSVYGNKTGGAFKEKDKLNEPYSPYAETKSIGEFLCQRWHEMHNISVLCLRFFTVYGPRQRPDLAIHKFTKLIFDDKPIPFYGDGSTSRDYTYIDDTIDGVLKAMDYIQKRNCFDIFNLGESQTINLKDMISELESAIGKKAILDWQPKQEGDVDYTCANIDKSRKILGYNPTYSFKEGIRNFIDWYKSTI